MKHAVSILKSLIPGASNHRGKALANTYWLLFDQLVRMVVGFFTLTILARQFGPEGFGELNYAIAFVALFSVLASFGTERIIMRELIQNESDTSNIIGTSFFIKLLGSLLLVLVSVSVSLVFNTESTITTILVSIFAVISVFQSFDVIEYLYQARLEAKYPVVVKLSAMLIGTLLKVFVAVTTQSLLLLGLMYLLEAVVTAVLLYAVFKRTKSHSFFVFQLQRAKSILRESAPLVFSGIFVTIYLRIDQVFLQHMTNAEIVGIYSASVRISEIPFFIGTILTNSAFPIIINNRKSSERNFLHDVQLLFSILTYCGFGIAVLTSLLAEPLISRIFGTEFLDAVPILRVHIWSILFVFMGLAKGIWMISENYTKLSLISAAAGAVSNIILNIVLIPFYGAMGAAIATVISYGISGYFIHFFINRTHVLAVLQSKSFLPHVLFRELRYKGLI